MTGSLEIGKFLRRHSVSIIRVTAHALHSTGFLGRLLEGSSGSFRSKTNNVLIRLYVFNYLSCLWKAALAFTQLLTARKLCSATLDHRYIYIIKNSGPRVDLCGTPPAAFIKGWSLSVVFVLRSNFPPILTPIHEYHYDIIYQRDYHDSPYQGLKKIEENSNCMFFAVQSWRNYRGSCSKPIRF